jgi:hypothetical protein
MKYVLNVIEAGVKAKITANTRQLKATWTVSLQPGLPLLHQELEGELAKTLQEEIDWEVMTDVLAGGGWTKVDIGRLENNKHAIDIHIWIEENVKGLTRQRGSIFMFENKEEAEWFTLRWAN